MIRAMSAFTVALVIVSCQPSVPPKPPEPVATVTTEVIAAWIPFEVTNASWYGPGFHGRLTASGEVYDENGISVAHRKLPFGTEVLFLNAENGETLVAPVTDRGPYAKFKGVTYYDGPERGFDLSKGAAEKLETIERGVAPLHFVVLN